MRGPPSPRTSLPSSLLCWVVAPVPLGAALGVSGLPGGDRDPKGSFGKNTGSERQLPDYFESHGYQESKWKKMENERREEREFLVGQGGLQLWVILSCFSSPSRPQRLRGGGGRKKERKKEKASSDHPTPTLAIKVKSAPPRSPGEKKAGDCPPLFLPDIEVSLRCLKFLL